MRVGQNFSSILDPAAEPLFGDQQVGLLQEELWHPSARHLSQLPTPAAPNGTADASTASGTAGSSTVAEAVSDSDSSSDDSLESYDMPEEKDTCACLNYCCSLCLHLHALPLLA